MFPYTKFYTQFKYMNIVYFTSKVVFVVVVVVTVTVIVVATSAAAAFPCKSRSNP